MMTDTAEKEQVHRTIREAQNGDREAFNRIMKNYYKLVWAICYSILRNHVLIEEAVQETFIKVFRQFKRLDKTGSFSAWLSIIARNVSIDIRRKELRRKATQVALQEQLEQKDDLEKQNKKKLMKELLHELPDKYRIPLILKYIHGMNNVEIAGLLSQSEPAIRGTLYRGRAMLKALMESELELKRDAQEEVNNDE